MAGLVNGTDLIIKMGGVANPQSGEVEVAFATSCSLEISMDEIDQTNKDSGGWKSIIGGTRSWSISSEALYQNESEASKNDFISFWNFLGNDTGAARTKCYVELSVRNAVAGTNVYYHGEAFVTSLSVNGGTEDQATYSVTLTGTGPLTEEDAS